MAVKNGWMTFEEDMYTTTSSIGGFLDSNDDLQLVVGSRHGSPSKPLSIALQIGKDSQGKEARIGNTYKGNNSNSYGKRRREDGHERRSTSDNLGGGSGDLNDVMDTLLRKKRNHRYSPEQLQVLESVFMGCTHPDQDQRLELSKSLGLQSNQIKFWFQNKRTQVKAYHERAEISILRQENEKLKMENVSISEAVRSLRIGNAQLKEELDLVSALAGRFMGQPTKVNRFEKYLGRSMYLVLAVAAVDELVKMAQTDEPLWVKRSEDGRDVLNHEEYLRATNPCIGMRPHGFVSEASRETGMVIINNSALVERLMDSNRWAEMFPCVVGRAITTDVISSGTGGTRDGALQLIHAELQVLSPLVPVREVKFLRYSKQHKEGVWVVVDVSIDSLCEHSAAPTTINCRRLPSGCIVQDMPNGYSKVTWVEHVEYDENVIHQLYRPLIHAGTGFGAQRWVATLQRQYEYLAVLNSSDVLVGSIPLGMVAIPVSGRRSILKLAQRMTSKFCEGICVSKVGNWNKVSANVDKDVRVMTCKSIDDPGVPPGLILSVATAVRLPVSPLRLFDFLRDEQLRSEWDIFSVGGPLQEMAHIAKGQNCGNCVSLLHARAINTTQSSMLILQETSIDAAGSLVVYAPIDMPSMNLVMNGGDSSYMALLPSGFAIVPDGADSPELNSKDLVPDVPNDEMDQVQKTSGSLLTVAFQILVNGDPTANLTVESVETINNLISCTVSKIKTALVDEN